MIEPASADYLMSKTLGVTEFFGSISASARQPMSAVIETIRTTAVKTTRNIRGSFPKKLELSFPEFHQCKDYAAAVPLAVANIFAPTTLNKTTKCH